MGPDAQQVEWVMLAGYFCDLAFVEYGLGESLPLVCTHMSEGAAALLKVFELRGTSPAFPVITVGGPRPDERKIDYSLTNSRRGLFAMYLAVIASGPMGAAGIAALVGDPPDASYIGEDSPVCTPEDQELASFLKALLLGQTPPGSHPTPASSDGRAFERVMLESISRGNCPAFLDALGRLLRWHAIAAQDQEHRRNPVWLMCVPGLALSRLAVVRGLIAPEQLPHDNPYLPHFQIPGGGSSVL